MSDLIDRQRALDAFDYWVKSPMVGYSNGLLRLHEMLEEIPPVKPEPCTDAISRQAAIDVLNTNRNPVFHDSVDYEGTMYDICKLPPVTPAEKVGHWILLDKCSNSGYYCSECRKRVVKEGWSDTIKIIKYCPNCGCHMEVEE